MDLSALFRRPWLTGICGGALLAFFAYLPSVASVPTPPSQIAIVFVYGCAVLWGVSAVVRHAARTDSVCASCAERFRLDRRGPHPCPHELLVRTAIALSREGEERRATIRVIRSLAPEEALSISVGTTRSFLRELGLHGDAD